MNNEIEKLARGLCSRSSRWNTCEECLEHHHTTRCYYRDNVDLYYDFLKEEE